MNYPIAFNKITEELEYYSEVQQMHQEAVKYLQGFKWCQKIINSVLYTNLGSKLCIFLFEIDNSASSEDNLIWVMVGDFPAMYLDAFGSKSTREVLETYVNLADDWIKQVKSGESTTECYPFEAEPTKEMATLFKKKVDFIRQTVIPNIDDIKLQEQL